MEQTADGKHRIVVRHRVPAPCEIVYEAWTDAEGIREWMSPATLFQPRPWNGTMLTWELTPQNGGTPLFASPTCNSTWGELMYRLKYVRKNEPGTQMYLAWQEKSDPTRFLHLFIFADEAAQKRHGESEAVKRFESTYSPELVGGEVLFTDYELISGKPTPEQWSKWQSLFQSAGAGKK
jgi:uncharacterized protein YndB with AHSA1/START domain